MFALILQVGGFIATYVLVVLYFAFGGRGLWPAFLAFALTIHFAGDYFRAFLKKDDPVVLGGFNLSDMLQPVFFLLWVGIALQFLGLLFALTNHSQWAGALGGLGLALAMTGFIGSIIYNPKAGIRW